MPTKTHGESNPPSAEYRAWRNMWSRCGAPYPNCRPWLHVRVSARWETFEAFLLDVGRRPTPLHSLDRWPDRAGDYEPGNVRWATRSQQNRNQRRARELTFRGRTRHLFEWADLLKLNPSTIKNRLDRGCTVADALRKPWSPRA